jgi:thymidylate synthase
MPYFDKAYIKIIHDILSLGETQTRRNGPVIELLNYSLTVTDVPLLTLRKINVKAVLDEFIWEWHGCSNIYELSHARGWWSPWADEAGEVPNAYGLYIEKQLPGLIEEVKSNPMSRRLRLVIDSPETYGFPACQPYKTFMSDGVYMHMTVLSRSSDMVVGFPNDILKDWLYLTLIADLAGQEAGSLTYNIVNAHVYTNTIEQVHAMPATSSFAQPRLELHPDWTPDTLVPADFNFVYESHPPIKVTLNV